MASLSNESTPRERLARMVTLTKRTRKFWRSSALIAFVGLSIALAVALHTKRVFRSETTVLFREGLPTREGEGESAAARVARLGPKLKDLLYARPKLEEVVRQYDLFPEKTRRSMLDGIEEMQSAVGFRARASDSFVVSFAYDDPVVARDVAARLAALMIDEYDRQNLDTATLARDFLRRKQAEAETGVDEASRSLAEFLAQHPQFQWGVNDSPYAPAPATPGAPGYAQQPRPTGAVASDPVLAGLERERAHVEAELFPGQPGHAFAGPGAMVAEAQKQRDAAAAALAAAEGALAEKLLTVKPAHPDAILARGHVEAAKRALAAAEGALARARSGEATPSASHPHDGLTPGRRAELERRRVALVREIEARRASLGAGGAPPPAARAVPRDTTADVVELETDWHRLRLDLDRAREKLHTIQQTARAADLSADAVARQGHEEMQILEPAYLPTRPDRGHGRVFFVGAAIALFFALGYTASRVILDDTLLDEGDVMALGGPPVLVVMPNVGVPLPSERAIIPAAPVEDEQGDDEDDEDDAADDDDKRRAPRPKPGEPDAPSAPPPPTPEDAAAPIPTQRGIVLHVGARPIVEAVFDDPEVEVIGAVAQDGGPPLAAPPPVLAALRILRHRLEQRRGDGSFVVSVMSPGLAEGKTTLALRLAVTLSEASRARVILVEGNFERPRLAASLGLKLPAKAGFSAQIHARMDGRPAAWGVVRLGPSLFLLAEPEEGSAHPEALHSALFETALAALRRSYDYVVVDGPAVVGSGDANVIEAASDGVLLLLRTGTTKGAALTRSMQQLGERRVLGVVLNAADAQAG